MIYSLLLGLAGAAMPSQADTSLPAALRVAVAAAVTKVAEATGSEVSATAPVYIDTVSFRSTLRTNGAPATLLSDLASAVGQRGVLSSTDEAKQCSVERCAIRNNGLLVRATGLGIDGTEVAVTLSLEWVHTNTQARSPYRVGVYRVTVRKESDGYRVITIVPTRTS